MKPTLIVPGAISALALLSCENPADNTTDATVSDSVEVESGAEGGVRYVLTDDSEISFVGSKVTGSHDGGFKEFDGFFVVSGDEVTGGEIVIDMESTWSDSDRLTGHLKNEDFFHVTEHPQAKFTVTGVEKSDDGAYSVSGNLMLRGVEKNISFPATASKDGDTISIDAEFDIKRKDWGIVYTGQADDLIRDEVVLKLDLTAEPGESDGMETDEAPAT